MAIHKRWFWMWDSVKWLNCTIRWNRMPVSVKWPWLIRARSNGTRTNPLHKPETQTMCVSLQWFHMDVVASEITYKSILFNNLCRLMTMKTSRIRITSLIFSPLLSHSLNLASLKDPLVLYIQCHIFRYPGAAMIQAITSQPYYLPWTLWFQYL